MKVEMAFGFIGLKRRRASLEDLIGDEIRGTFEYNEDSLDSQRSFGYFSEENSSSGIESDEYSSLRGIRPDSKTWRHLNRGTPETEDDSAIGSISRTSSQRNEGSRSLSRSPSQHSREEDIKEEVCVESEVVEESVESVVVDVPPLLSSSSSSSGKLRRRPGSVVVCGVCVASSSLHGITTRPMAAPEAPSPPPLPLEELEQIEKDFEMLLRPDDTVANAARDFFAKRVDRVRAWCEKWQLEVPDEDVVQESRVPLLGDVCDSGRGSPASEESVDSSSSTCDQPSSSSSSLSSPRVSLDSPPSRPPTPPPQPLKDTSPPPQPLKDTSSPPQPLKDTSSPPQPSTDPFTPPQPSTDPSTHLPPTKGPSSTTSASSSSTSSTSASLRSSADSTEGIQGKLDLLKKELALLMHQDNRLLRQFMTLHESIESLKRLAMSPTSESESRDEDDIGSSGLLSRASSLSSIDNADLSREDCDEGLGRTHDISALETPGAVKQTPPRRPIYQKQASFVRQRISFPPNARNRPPPLSQAAPAEGAEFSSGPHVTTLLLEREPQKDSEVFV